MATSLNQRSGFAPLTPMTKKSRQIPRVIQITTWYGLKAGVENGSGFWHKAGFGKFLLPHPPLVNRLLRLGLPQEKKERLGITHEFGHLQTLPVYLLYTVALVGVFIGNGGGQLTAWVALFISTHAFWEILSELYVIHHWGSLYKLYYEEISMLPRLIFWTTMFAIMLSGWMFL